jgi:hypothetical protein
MPLLKGPSAPKTARKPGRDTYRLTNITSEVCKTDPHPLAKRFTKFITNYDKERVEIPRNLLSARRDTAGTQPNAERCLDVGQIPED